MEHQSVNAPSANAFWGKGFPARYLWTASPDRKKIRERQIAVWSPWHQTVTSRWLVHGSGWFPNPIVSRHREKRDSEALFFRGWTVSNSFTFYEHGKLWEQPASKCLYSACERCPRCWIHSLLPSTLFSLAFLYRLVPIPTCAAIITSKQRQTHDTATI